MCSRPKCFLLSFPGMGRFNRVVAVDLPHHVTQRGNGRRFVLDGDADRTIYLKLLRENIVLYGVTLVGHCLMSNHYYSCPLDQSHVWEALRYTELNPVRAGLVSEAEVWPWSSAACHCGTKEQDECLTLESWSRQWTSTTWREYLGAGETEERLAVIRQRTYTGRPLGTQDFIQDLEKVAHRRIALQKRGPREKIVTDRRQGELTFDS
jgi:putative transposase